MRLNKEKNIIQALYGFYLYKCQLFSIQTLCLQSSENPLLKAFRGLETE